MPDDDPASPAVALSGVSKIYRLHASPMSRMLDGLGVPALPFLRSRSPQFRALSGIDLTAAAGERLAIVGRNGAGKTTLLKLMLGFFAPTTGTVRVKGRVRALMELGLGFHPNFTGLENIKAALAYNGLDNAGVRAATDDIVEFCDLGDFLNQPVQTYSAGMQSRLQFAVATAVRPEVLIVDEVLGAGDAYFAGRSAERVRRLAQDGCTMLLVSHSMQQVLEFCTRAVWLERGRILMDGPALAIVKAYEEFIEELSGADRRSSRGNAQDEELQQEILSRVLAPRERGADDSVTEGGVYRWRSRGELKVASLRFDPPSGVSEGADLALAMTILPSISGELRCRYGVAIFGLDGRFLTRSFSAPHRVSAQAGVPYEIRFVLSPVLLRPGRYVVSVSIHEALDLSDMLKARRYDLVSRSYSFSVAGTPEPSDGIFDHPVTWMTPCSVAHAQSG